MTTLIKQTDSGFQLVDVHLKPVDNGTYKKRKQALKALQGLEEPAVAYRAPSLALSRRVGKRKVLKEVIYEGEFTKEGCSFNGGEDVEFSVTPELIDHWVSTSEQMRSKGIEQPLYLSAAHDEAECTKSGKVSDAFRDKNDRGEEALFLVFDLDDGVDDSVLEGRDVSVFAEPYYKGYDYPLRHVALTPDPVIPNLSGFTTIAASLTKVDGDKEMKALAKALGIEFSESSTDQEVVALITKAFNALKAAKKEPEKPKIAASLSRMAIEARNSKIDALCGGDSPKITPAVAKKLKEKYCTEDAVTLALSNEESGAIDSDGFEAVILALSENEPILSTKEKTKGQVSLKAEDNPMVAAAQKRANGKVNAL